LSQSGQIVTKLLREREESKKASKEFKIPFEAI
jgi:hypothetical protein